MKNKIYLTQEGKEEIEAIIKQLEIEEKIETKNNQLINLTLSKGIIGTYKDILSNSVILPKIKEWEESGYRYDYGSTNLNKNYPNGVIIK